jgi:5-methylcytosine-specific restriction endonuclease McrA
MPSNDPRYDTTAWRQTRLVVLERDRGQCQMHRDGRCRGYATEVDHIVAVAHGGDFYALSNLRAACSTCNRVAGAEVMWQRYHTTTAPYLTRF